MPFLARRLFLLGFWCLVAATTVLSLLPVDELPPMMINWWDKAQHALGFAALTTLGLCAYWPRWRPLIAGLLLYGVAIELAQAATGWRTGDVLDWIADATGVMGTLLPWLAIQSFRKPHATSR